MAALGLWCAFSDSIVDTRIFLGDNSRICKWGRAAVRRPVKSILRVTWPVLLLAASSSTISAGELATSWAYRPVARPPVPQLERPFANPIDAFIVRELAERQLSLSPPAAPCEIVRRTKFDLLGLPPTPEEIDRFEHDSSPDAYERLIDGWLASPHYGERWGRHWLDVVRYADSAGFNADPVRPLAYKYRDYVIQSFNDDVPYDQFVREQIAGDELAPDRPAGWIAAGFLRLGPDESNASNIPLARQELLNELTSAVSAIFLAQSLGCAQCHDHKFDPLTKLDFFRLEAFFAGVIPVERTPIGTPQQLAEYRQQYSDYEARIAPLANELWELERPARIAAAGDKRMKFPDIVLDAIDAPAERRSALQHQLAFFGERQIPITDADIQKRLDESQKSHRQELLAALTAEKKQQPEPPAWLDAMTAADGDPLPAMHNLSGGNYAKPLEEVEPGVPEVVNFSAGSLVIVPPRPGTSGRRSALATWLTDPRNPLTARVIVNRIWQGHFGRAIAPNANDFGSQSPLPTHPRLLDWLAAEFIEPTVNVGGEFGLKPWSIKRMHKLILLSQTYRQAADRTANDGSDAARNRARTVDPGNQWYWCFPARRLEAEAIRDACLFVSGRLNPEMFGPGVQPELPPGFTHREAWKVSADPSDRLRRSVYILAKRNLPYPWLGDFDLPDAHESCARRMQTTTAPQALTMLNSRMVLDEARAFAGRLLNEFPQGKASEIVPAAYRRALGRFPTAEEETAAAEFLRDQESLLFSSSPFAGLLPINGFPKFLPPERGAAIIDFCHTLMNSNEFLYLD